jgi:hypothetical protein
MAKNINFVEDFTLTPGSDDTVTVEFTPGGVNYTWPATDGLVGQALTTDGVGNIEFGTPAGSIGAAQDGTLVAPATVLDFLSNFDLVDEGSGVVSVALNGVVLQSEVGQPNGVASLNGSGVIPQSQVPAIAITNTFVVASEAAMLALVAETGDVAIRTDVSMSYILAGTDPSNISDWEELLSPPNAVQSVNGNTGVVVLDTDDIDEGITNLYFTDERSDDRVAALIQDGTGLDWTYDDGGNTLTGDVNNLTVTEFASPNISQWTNDAGYITSSQTFVYSPGDTDATLSLSGGSSVDIGRLRSISQIDADREIVVTSGATASYFGTFNWGDGNTGWPESRGSGMETLRVSTMTSVSGFQIFQTITPGAKLNYKQKISGDLTSWGATIELIDSSGGQTINGDLTLTENINVNGLTYGWPASHAPGQLRNNGSGTLTWEEVAGGIDIAQDGVVQAAGATEIDFLVNFDVSLAGEVSLKDALSFGAASTQSVSGNQYFRAAWDGADTTVALQHNGSDVLVVGEDGIEITDDIPVFFGGNPFNRIIWQSSQQNLQMLFPRLDIRTNLNSRLILNDGGDCELNLFSTTENSRSFVFSSNGGIAYEFTSDDSEISQAWFNATPIPQPILTSGTQQELTAALGSTSGLGLVDDSAAAAWVPVVTTPEVVDSNNSNSYAPVNPQRTVTYLIDTLTDGAQTTHMQPDDWEPGDIIRFVDYESNFSSDSFTIDFETHNFEGTASATLVMGVDDGAITLEYIDVTRGFQRISVV